MLILTRKEKEAILIGDNIRIVIVRAGGNVRVGIEAPPEVRVIREELVGTPYCPPTPPICS